MATLAAGTPRSSGSSWFLTEPCIALESLESSRYFELFEGTRVLLVVSSWNNLILRAVGMIFSSEFGVDVSTLPCHQQLPVPPSSVVQVLVMLLVLVVETWGGHLLLAKAASCCLLTALSGYSRFLVLFQSSLLKDRAKILKK